MLYCYFPISNFVHLLYNWCRGWTFLYTLCMSWSCNWSKRPANSSHGSTPGPRASLNSPFSPFSDLTNEKSIFHIIISELTLVLSLHFQHYNHRKIITKDVIWTNLFTIGNSNWIAKKCLSSCRRANDSGQQSNIREISYRRPIY